MTNQSTALRDTEREQDRLRPPTHPVCKTEPLDATKRIEPERCTPSPSRLHSTPSPLSLYPRKTNRDYGDPPTVLSNSDHTTPQDERPKTPEDDSMANDVGEFINCSILKLCLSLIIFLGVKA